MADRALRVCVYCASHVGNRAAFGAAAGELGAELGRRGVDLVFGGGQVGLMGLVADAALEAGAQVTGVITEQLRDREIAHMHVTELRIVSDMPARKKAMYELGDAFLALPGGIGTMEELFEVLTWAYLGLHPKPVGLLNVEGYYDPLIEFLDHAVREGLAKPRVMDLLVVESEPSAALDRLLSEGARL